MFTSSCLIGGSCTTEQIATYCFWDKVAHTLQRVKLTVGCSYMCAVQLWAIILKAVNTDYECNPVPLSFLALMMLEEGYFG